jgi:hypothetical protein
MRREQRAFARTCSGFEARDIHIEAIWINVDEDGRRAGKHDHLRRGNEGEVRNEHRIARPDPLGHQHEKQCVGAVGATDAVFRTAEFGELPLELGDLRSQHILAVLQHGSDHLLDAAAEMLTLRCQVDEGRNRPCAVFIHALLPNSLTQSTMG